MNFAPIDLTGGGTALNFMSANVEELEAEFEAMRAAAVIADPTASLGWLEVAAAGDGPRFIVTAGIGPAATTPGAPLLSDLRAVFSYGSNLEAITRVASPKITQAVIDGYTLIAAAESAGTHSGFRFCNISLMQRPSP